jgi:O-antigen ligase
MPIRLKEIFGLQPQRESWLLWMIYANAFVIPISSFLSARLVVLTLVYSLFLRKNYRDILRNSWDIAIYFGVLAIGLIYSHDKATGLRVLETSFSLLAFPLIIGKLNSPSWETIEKIFGTFILGLLLAGFMCLAESTIDYARTQQLSAFFFYNLTDFIQIQPTYFAYYLIFAIGFVLYLLFYESNRLPTWALMTSIVLAFALLILTGGRTTFISLILVLSFFVLKYLLEPRTGNRNLVFGIVIFMLLALFGVNSIESWNQSMMGDYWERSQLWESAIRATQDPLFGVGTGDSKSDLNEYFQAHGLKSFAEESYNPHNQFVQTYFANGLIGALALLVMLGRPIYLAVRRNNALGILIFFPFLIYGMTEVFLGRFQGVVFFAFLQQLFMASFYAAQPTIALKGSSFS